MNEEQAREWARLADVERAESPDGKTGWDRFLERHVHPAERRHGERRQQGERRQPSEVPRAVQGVSGKARSIAGAPRCWDDEPGCSCGGRHPDRVLTPAEVAARGGTHSLHVFTSHPEDYELMNHRDGTRWRGTQSGQWRRVE